MPMQSAFDILVPGEINPDLILSGDVVPEFGQVEKLVESFGLTIGSSSVIFACGAARLGLKVAFVGVCGKDIFGRFMLDEMSTRGINISAVNVDPEKHTGFSVILNKGHDRAILTFPGTMTDLRAEAVTDRLLSQARHLHVASYFLQASLQPDLPALFRRAHHLSLTTSLDTNWDPYGRWQGVEELISLTDVFLPNENEALAISQASNLEQAVECLSLHAGLVAVKRGSQGALAHRRDETASANALSGAVVDTVGAGDTFDAGFIYGFLNGWGLQKSLSLATVCGSLSTRAAGGTASQPSLEAALRYVSPS
jgi:sugar/nucleoside kinase (ribokinase family)